METGDQATQKGHSSELVMMSMQLSVTYWVICLDLRNPILQRPMMMLPGQWFIFLQNICFTFLLSVNVHSWLLACTCSPHLPSPAPDSFSLWKSKIIPLLNRSFHRVTCCKIPNVASGLCISWGRMWESEQRSTSGISPHSVDTAFSAGHQITFMTVVPMPRPTRAASDVTPGPLSSRFFSLPFPNLPTISFAFPPNWKK